MARAVGRDGTGPQGEQPVRHHPRRPGDPGMSEEPARPTMNPTFFETPENFRAWLAGNSPTVPFLWVGFFKKGSGRKGLPWPESVDEALCYGWIDGIRKGIDAESYAIRFTPRKA